MDFRPGRHRGSIAFQDDDGNRYCGKLIYDEIEAPRRFTGVDVFTDEQGNSNDELPTAHTSYDFAEKSADETIVTNITRYDRPRKRAMPIIDMGVEAGVSIHLCQSWTAIWRRLTETMVRVKACFCGVLVGTGPIPL